MNQYDEPVKTLRDEFAMVAIQGILANTKLVDLVNDEDSQDMQPYTLGNTDMSIICELAYNVADTMLLARNS